MAMIPERCVIVPDAPAGFPLQPNDGVQRVFAETKDLMKGTLAIQKEMIAMLQNHQFRHANGWSRAPDHALCPLHREAAAEGPPPAPQLGDLSPPGLFPATHAAATALSHAQLDALAGHYGMEFRGPSAADRSTEFLGFIGCGQA